MLNQTVLPFKLSGTSEQLTAHAGLALFGELYQLAALKALGLFPFAGHVEAMSYWIKS